jgi:hypothetical protein
VRAGSQRPSDPKRPPVGRDEQRVPRRADPRDPRPLIPHDPARVDSADERAGVGTRVRWCAPLAARRQGPVPTPRTRRDGAPVRKEWVEGSYPAAERIVRVPDHRTPHPPASRSEAFPPAAATRLAAKRARQSTPQHGSGLAMAESELRVVGRPWVARRLPTQETVARAVAAGEPERKAAGGTARVFSSWRGRSRLGVAA